MGAALQMLPASARLPANRYQPDVGALPGVPFTVPLAGAVARLRALPVPPLWLEGRIGLEAAMLARDPIWRGQGVADGNGRPVLLIPGFLAGDGSLRMLTAWLRRAGYRTRRAGVRANVGCSQAACEQLEARLELMAERSGDRVVVVGQSRGGHFARALAVRRPDLVAGIVCLGSPMLNPFAVHPLVLLQVGVVGVLGSASVPGLFSHRCWRGSCCERFRDALVEPFPDEVGYVSMYSRSDGIVDWRSCLDPAADQVEVNASHCGMSVNVEAYRATAHALAAFAERATA